MRVALRADEHDAVLVEKPRIALDEDAQVLAVAEAEPGAAIGQDVGLLRGGGVQRRAHALADLAVPLPAPRHGVHAGLPPQAQLRRMRAAAVAAADEGRARRGDAPQRLAGVADAGDARRVGVRADDDEVVEHHVPPRAAEALRDEALLRRAVVHEDQVRIAAPPDIERLAGAERHHARGDAGRPGEGRQDVTEEAGLLRAGGGGDGDAPLLRRRGRRQRQEDGSGEGCGDKPSPQGRGHRMPSRSGLRVGLAHHRRSPRRKAAASGVAGVAKKRAAGACSSTRPRWRNTTSPARRRA